LRAILHETVEPSEAERFLHGFIAGERGPASNHFVHGSSRAIPARAARSFIGMMSLSGGMVILLLHHGRQIDQMSGTRCFSGKEEIYERI